MRSSGCRVPLPWTRAGSSFGFGQGGAWLPQPAWFGDYSVQAQDEDPASALNLYRQALRIRRTRNVDDVTVDWPAADDPDLLHFARTGGWHTVVNFATSPRPLPPGRVILSSAPVVDGCIAGESTVWLDARGSRSPDDVRRV